LPGIKAWPPGSACIDRQAIALRNRRKGPSGGAIQRKLFGASCQLDKLSFQLAHSDVLTKAGQRQTGGRRPGATLYSTLFLPGIKA